MNDLQIFNFENKKVRTSIINGEPYFCLKDVCDILELTNSRQVKDDVCNLTGVSSTYVSYPSGRKLADFINEQNLYRVIFKSRKPEAEKFQNWVFNDVLPQIRKTGQYSLNDDLIIKKGYEILQKRAELLLQENQIMKPKAESYDTFISSKGLHSIKEVANIFGTGQNKLFEILRENKYFFKRNGQNFPYQQYIDNQYFELKEKTIKNGYSVPVIKVTPKGVILIEKILNKLKEKNI